MWAARYLVYYVDPFTNQGMWLHRRKDSPVILQLVWLTFKSNRFANIREGRKFEFF